MVGVKGQMKFLDWYLKISAASAIVGASMEFFMIQTGFCFQGLITLTITADDKVTVLESEKRAWESSSEAQAIKEALNPWRHLDDGKK